VSAGAVRLSEALGIAGSAVRAFRDIGAGVDAEPVGSVRRCRPIVGDVEVLVDARALGEASATRAIGGALTELGATRGHPNKAGARAPWGPRYFRALLPNGGEHAVQLDVFVCLPPAEYGVLRLIRTGSRDFSQAVVTRLHRYNLESRDGRVVNRTSGKPVSTPTEEGVLRLARLPWIPPSDREMDFPRTLAAFQREAGPDECQDPPTTCRICGMAHRRGPCP